MPFSITSRPTGRRLPPVRPLAGGGYERASIPDPNDAMATYARGQTPTVGVGSGDALGAALMARGVAARGAADTAHEADAASRGVAVMNTVAPDPRWAGFFQALAERGADRVRTGGAARMTNQPVTIDPGSETLEGTHTGSASRAGYFDVQDPNAARRAALAGLLKTRDLNQYGRSR